ncbi:hypothetical protein [Sulfuricurvum sp.]|uniref:hypothetical protein n=1 Tax=Sulfuricurvum sp. TaxID=2025608 RepID=UPI002607E863|nr:hypothetical protein [Sulfuricurvum sp.]MDD3596355.1 hypothetical protein [Sulfuricurvum sp.]
MTIISILGLAGRDRDGNPTTSQYVNATDLTLQDGNYLNSTDVLIQNFDAEFFFIGTEKAIATQKSLLSYQDKRVLWKAFDTDNLSHVFQLVLELTENISNNCIVDLTHGLRHQTITAAFAAFIRTALSKQKMKLLFAADSYDVSIGKHYRYIYLDEYINLAAASFTLSSFVKTLSAPSDLYDDPLIDALHGFSRELFSNHLSALFNRALPTLDSALQSALVSNKLSFLDAMIDDALLIVESFKMAKSHPELYRTYLDLADIMFRFNYPLLAATYLYEGSQLYFYHHFHRLGITAEPPEYDVLSDIKMYVSRGVVSADLEIIDEFFYCTNAEYFKQASDVFENIRLIRNNTAHLNLDYTNEGMYESLSDAIKLTKQLYLIDDIFAHLKTKGDQNSPSCRNNKIFFMKINAHFFDKEYGIQLSHKNIDKHAARLLLVKHRDYAALAMNMEDKTKLNKAFNHHQFHQILDYALTLKTSSVDTMLLQEMIKSYQYR